MPINDLTKYGFEPWPINPRIWRRSQVFHPVRTGAIAPYVGEMVERLLGLGFTEFQISVDANLEVIIDVKVIPIHGVWLG